MPPIGLSFWALHRQSNQRLVLSYKPVRKILAAKSKKYKEKNKKEEDKKKQRKEKGEGKERP